MGAGTFPVVPNLELMTTPLTQKTDSPVPSSLTDGRETVTEGTLNSSQAKADYTGNIILKEGLNGRLEVSGMEKRQF